MEALNQQNCGLTVCLDHAGGGWVVGRRLAQPLVFFDIGQLLLSLERVMDEQNYPQAYQRRHTFTPDRIPNLRRACLPENAMTQAEVDAAQGQWTTFLLLVFTRRLATWQGFVDWLDGTGLHGFSSDLELLALLDWVTPGGSPGAGAST